MHRWNKQTEIADKVGPSNSSIISENKSTLLLKLGNFVLGLLDSLQSNFEHGLHQRQFSLIIQTASALICMPQNSAAEFLRTNIKLILIQHILRWPCQNELVCFSCSSIQFRTKTEKGFAKGPLPKTFQFPLTLTLSTLGVSLYWSVNSCGSKTTKTVKSRSWPVQHLLGFALDRPASYWEKPSCNNYLLPQMIRSLPHCPTFCRMPILLHHLWKGPSTSSNKKEWNNGTSEQNNKLITTCIVTNSN